MKILYAYSEPLPSSKARAIQTVATCHALAQLHEVFLLADFQKDPLLPLGLRKTDSLNLVSIRRTLGPLTLGAWFYIRLQKLIKQIRPDIIFVRHPKIAARLVDDEYRFIYEVHEILSDKHPEISDLADMELKLARGCTGLVFISAGLKRRWNELYGLGVPAQIIRSGAFYDPGLNKDLSLIIPEAVYYTGSAHYRWKGVETLLSAVKHLSRVKLVFVGDLCTSLECQNERISCLGWLPHKEVENVLRRAEITVIPNSGCDMVSRLYTSPLKLVEYMAAKTAIIASDLPSVREIVSEKEALFFTPDDPASLAEKIQILLEDGALRERLAKAAHHKAAEFCWDERARRLSDFFLNLS